MTKLKSEARRVAILSAATRLIASQGLGAATATIAKEAGVSNGSLFLYFKTKAVLYSELYVDLKAEFGAIAVAGLPPEGEPREQIRHVWTQWLQWATNNPEKRRALAQLEVSDDIIAESRRTVRQAQMGLAELLKRCSANGPMQDVSLDFVLALINAMADVTMDAIIQKPVEAETHSNVAFEAIWRVLAGTSLPAED